MTNEFFQLAAAGILIATGLGMFGIFIYSFNKRRQQENCEMMELDNEILSLKKQIQKEKNSK